MRMFSTARRTSAAILAAAIALIVCTHASHAAGTNLRWDHCYGDGGVINKDFACTTSTGANVVVGSLELDAATIQTSGLEFVVDITAAAASLPAWWQFKNTGSCRQTALSANFTPNGLDVVCVDWAVGKASGGIGSYSIGTLGLNTATLSGAIAVPPSAIINLQPGTEYFTFNLRFSNVKTVGTDACGGCQTPVCIALRQIKATSVTPANDVLLTSAAHAPNSNYVSWQQGTGIVPILNGNCAGFDSAGYAVSVATVGRGQVVRSRIKTIYPTGSPISLYAQPFPGDRFVAWSGDTTGTEDTLNIVVNANKQFTATFERDPAAAAVITSVTDVPGDEGSQVSVKFDRSPLDTSPSSGSGWLDTYRVQRQPVANPAAPWTNAGFVTATAQNSYEVIATTPGDSTALDAALQRFRVMARSVVDTFTWTSGEVVGYSVDALAPPAPASVTGTLSSGFASFFWAAVSAPDLAAYRIYRSETAPVPIDLAHRVASTTVAGYSDSPGHFLHYAVTSLDTHGNESPATPFVPLNAAGTDGAPAPRTLTFGAPTPSPMTDQVAMSIGLPQTSHVTARILDAQGRLVLQLHDADTSAGWSTVRWDGRDHDGRPAAAGLYFLHIRTSLGERVARIVRIQ